MSGNKTTKHVARNPNAAFVVAQLQRLSSSSSSQPPPKGRGGKRPGNEEHIEPEAKRPTPGNGKQKAGVPNKPPPGRAPAAGAAQPATSRAVVPRLPASFTEERTLLRDKLNRSSNISDFAAGIVGNRVMSTIDFLEGQPSTQLAAMSMLRTTNRRFRVTTATPPETYVEYFSAIYTKGDPQQIEMANFLRSLAIVQDQNSVSVFFLFSCMFANLTHVFTCFRPC